MQAVIVPKIQKVIVPSKNKIIVPSVNGISTIQPVTQLTSATFSLSTSLSTSTVKVPYSTSNIQTP